VSLPLSGGKYMFNSIQNKKNKNKN